MPSWDEIRQQNRREWVRKWALFLVGLPLLVYVGSIFIPTERRLFRRANEQLREHGVPEHSQSSQTNSPTRSVAELKSTSPGSSASKSLQPTPTNPAAVKIDSESTISRDNSRHVADASEQKLIEDQRRLRSGKDDKLRRQAETALRDLEQKIDRLQGDDMRLDEFGGEEWATAVGTWQAALRAEDLDESLRLAEEASALLDQLALTVAFAELHKQIDGQPISTQLAAMVRFSREHPDHPRLTELNETVAERTREEWLSLAAGELAAASPADPGFAEAWLPIASAWQVVGNDAEARDAIRQARDALPRMTDPERIIASTIDLCQHESFDASFAEPLISEAVALCEQIADKWGRGTYYAHLSGLAAKFSLQTLSERLLERALSPENMNAEFGVTAKLVLTQRCRAAAWTQPPETLFSHCRELEKLRYPKPRINANCYAHAAMAAARHGDRPAFVEAMLRAENALAPLRVYDYPNYIYAERLAEANLLQRRWRAAVIIANNIPDPSIRASLLFRVMKDAPQEVRAAHIDGLFQRFGDQRWASCASSGYAEYRLRSGDEPLAVADWIQALPQSSHRAAAYAGVSRAQGVPTAVADGRDDVVAFDNVPIPAPELDDPVSLLEVAERLAADTADPIDAAFLWFRIAKTWNLLGSQSRYHAALGQLDNRLFDAWAVVWKKRPPVRPGYNGGFIDADDRHETAERQMIGRIVICHRFLAEMQADLSDPRGAMESCLDLANAAGFLHADPTFANFDYLQIKAILDRLASETGVGSDAIPLAEHKPQQYSTALIAAMSGDLATLKTAADELKALADRTNARRLAPTQAARAFGELAILHARRGNIDAYRDARRSAQSFLARSTVPTEMKLVLATADALAGEYALAEDNLVRGSLIWFGDANRARSQLAVSLADAGKWQQALEHAHRIDPDHCVYRGDAWQAVAKSRAQSGAETTEELDDWLASIESMHDRVAVLCGLALAAGNTSP